MKKSKALLSLILSLALMLQMVMFVPMFAEASEPTPILSWDASKKSTTSGNIAAGDNNETITYWPASPYYNWAYGLGDLSGYMMTDYTKKYTLQIPISGVSTSDGSKTSFGGGFCISFNFTESTSNPILKVDSDGKVYSVNTEVYENYSETDTSWKDTGVTADGSATVIGIVLAQNTDNNRTFDVYWNDILLSTFSVKSANFNKQGVQRFEFNKYQTGATNWTENIGNINLYENDLYNNKDDGALYIWDKTKKPASYQNYVSAGSNNETISYWGASNYYNFAYGLGNLDTYMVNDDKTYTLKIPVSGTSNTNAGNASFGSGFYISINVTANTSNRVIKVDSTGKVFTVNGSVNADISEPQWKETTVTADGTGAVIGLVMKKEAASHTVKAYWDDILLGEFTIATGNKYQNAVTRFEFNKPQSDASVWTENIGDIKLYKGDLYASVEPPVVEPDDPDDDGAKYTWNINNPNNNTVATEETVGVYKTDTKYWYYFGLGEIKTNGPVIIDGSGTYTLKIPVDTSLNVGEFHVCANFTYGTSTDILVVENNGNIKIATGRITTDSHGGYADTGKTLSSVSNIENNGDIIGLVINYDDSPKTITVYWNNTNLGKVEIADSVTTGNGTLYTGKLTRFQIDIPTTQYNSNTSWGNKIGDIKLYEGDLLKGLDITPSASKVLLPPEGKKVEVTFTSADVDDANEVWTVSGESENVKFVGNVLTVTGSAQPGTVEVTLTDNNSGKSTVFEYPLEKAYYDFDNISELPAGWTNASIMSDENGGYLRPNENGINYTFKNGAAGTISGRYVIDVRVKSNDVDVNADFKNAASLVQPATSSINGYTYSPKYIADEWTDIRIVYDTIKGEVSVIKGNEALQVNDTLYVYDYDRNLGRLVLGWDIDDVHIYSATTESVSVYDAYINSCAIGCNAEADYAFFAMDGSGEGESVYQWYVSNTADAEEAARELIVGATSKTYNVPNNYLGKYLWVKVKPVSEKGESLSGVDTWSEPVKVELFATNSDIKLMTTGDSPYEIYKLEIGQTTKVANTAIITNNSGSPIKLMLVTALKNNGVLSDIKVNTITVNNGETENFDASLNVTAAAGDNVVFYLWNADNLTPYSGLEAVGYTAE